MQNSLSIWLLPYIDVVMPRIKLAKKTLYASNQNYKQLPLLLDWHLPKMYDNDFAKKKYDNEHLLLMQPHQKKIPEEVQLNSFFHVWG
jgi:hypothetical protein